MESFPMPLDADRLAELVAQKYQLLQMVQELVVRQQELIDRGEISELLEVLVVKQKILEQLQGVERQLEPFGQQDPQTRRWPSPQLRQATADRLQSCQLLLTDILQREKQCEAQLLRRREEAALQLRQLCTTGQMLAAYQDLEPIPQNRLDLVSEH